MYRQFIMLIFYHMSFCFLSSKMAISIIHIFSPFLAGTGPRSAIRIYAKCLRSDIEYKTLSISHTTTSAEVIWMLLSKFKMRHRDPKLFYLTMDIGVAALSRTLSLDEDSRPAELKSCHPWGECKFTLQMRRGGLVRIHDSVLMAESRYKCLLIVLFCQALHIPFHHCFSFWIVHSNV